ncbi:lipid-binding SYLF domain-containing protein, partial [Kaarinaea lacus]
MLQKNRFYKTIVLFSASLLMLSACGGWNPDKPEESRKAAEEAVAKFKQKDPSIKSFFNNAYAYAIFPDVGKGGMVVGGAYGNGRVYRGGQYIGDATLTQATVGFQLGGQVYSELIFFSNKAAFDRFKEDRLEFDAQVSAIAITAGAAAKAAYEKGIAVFTMTKGGLMYEASV